MLRGRFHLPISEVSGQQKLQLNKLLDNSDFLEQPRRSAPAAIASASALCGCRQRNLAKCADGLLHPGDIVNGLRHRC